MKIRKYRVIASTYSGYEAQIWRIWWPFWLTLGFVSIHTTVEGAIEQIERHNKVYWQSDKN